MTTNNPHDEERRTHALFATRLSDPEYQARLGPLHEGWRRFNRDYCGDRLKPPHIVLGRTAPRSLAHCAQATGYGARLQITLNHELVFGTHPGVIHPWPPAASGQGVPAVGTRRFIEDLLLRQTVRQHVIEVDEPRRGAEDGYEGFGELFTEHANRIGAMHGLAEVAVRNRSGLDQKPLAKFWPHCVREAAYYGDDITEALLDLAAGSSRSGRRSPAPPSLGLLELIHGRLISGHVDAAKEMLRRHIERLEHWRLDRRPARRRVELGLEDVDGSPLGTVEFAPWWLVWNNGCVRKMAEAIAEWRAFYDLPILADALEDAGCGDLRILRHLREPMEHTCRCWVLRGLLGGEKGTEG